MNRTVNANKAAKSDVQPKRKPEKLQSIFFLFVAQRHSCTFL